MSFTLETKRLLLRPYKLRDAAHLFLLNSDDEVMRYTGKDPFENVAQAEKIIRYELENTDSQWLKYGMGRLACIDRDNGAFVGFCGIKTHESTKLIDLGYRFMRPLWGNGYATEACNAVLQHAFNQLGIDQIVAHIHEYNTGSQRVAQKLGFSLDHRFLWEGKLSGRYYKLTDDAYQNQKN